MEFLVLDCISKILTDYKEIIIALIAVIGVFFTALIALRNNNKNLLIKTVTDERAQWRKDLRDYCADFSKLVYEYVSTDNTTNKPNIIKLKTHIKLRTNPSNEPAHVLDQNILNELQEIVAMLCSDTIENKDIIYNKLTSLETNVQKLLKQEWEKSKREAVSGKLSK